MNPGPPPDRLYPHMYQERVYYPKYPRFTEEEIKIPPSHPHTRENIHHFTYSKDPYFH
jgi:hypothetical protein